MGQYQTDVYLQNPLVNFPGAQMRVVLYCVAWGMSEAVAEYRVGGGQWLPAPAPIAPPFIFESAPMPQPPFGPGGNLVPTFGWTESKAPLNIQQTGYRFFWYTVHRIMHMNPNASVWYYKHNRNNHGPPDPAMPPVVAQHRSIVLSAVCTSAKREIHSGLGYLYRRLTWLQCYWLGYRFFFADIWRE
ncbi:hypothetical protein VKT23_017104 [Stygiomarasmius scandens]|uniref:Uncharacterized protein n=1 Tax=Marasmiellus scandens TaxID=2682957 RepID=A0ABR1IXK6_9AGAR